MTTQPNPDEEARYAAFAARMDDGDFGPVLPGPTPQEQAQLDGMLTDMDRQLDVRDVDEIGAPTPPMPPAHEIVSEAEVDELIEIARGLGRPSVGSTRPRGESPKLQVRLPHELDEQLRRRAAAEHRRPSEIMRDALAQYLRAS
ncbi:ribbon-helix-helix protein, CopG family [Microbacterium album]|uniref:Ribbon-helix-helix protein CopG domain-containing protein n=1 Tax=Microbacterium album TaxID=2053191 RepID=A0A917IKE9_9MICO|nr:ribbon-helix-helix protein, CopG family [Microbacterium album]GGH51201.1 hypothetical protein GCM10010921_30470 [Microbacterium album]